MHRLRFLIVPLCLLAVAAILFFFWNTGRLYPPLPRPRPHLVRPQGMAPVAFRAFLQACSAARVHPFRIAQTLGDAPRSVGYHLRDGRINGEDYSAAVDIGVSDLSSHKRAEFLEAMARVGFASWFRTGPKWKNQQHVHAVYAGLPMKTQLQRQVRLWNRERARDGHKTLRWQRTWRRFWS